MMTTKKMKRLWKEHNRISMSFPAFEGGKKVFGLCFENKFALCLFHIDLKILF